MNEARRSTDMAKKRNPPREETKTNNWRSWFDKDVIAFFLLGIIVAFPTMVVSTGANAMFTGITGAFGLCLSCTAAATSFITPLFLQYVPCNTRMLVSTVASILSFIICTLGSGKGGPAVGTILAGFVYAFATNAYLAVAAFYDHRTVVALSSGSGFAEVIGPAIYIGLRQAFHGNWKNTYYVCLALTPIQPLAWWILLTKEGRLAADKNRLSTIAEKPSQDSGSTTPTRSDQSPSKGLDLDGRLEINQTVVSGFGNGKTRLGLFFKTLVPRYVVPLFICTTCAAFSIFGLAPIFESLDTFRDAPTGDLSYEISFMLYGAAQFLFSLSAMLVHLKNIWLWAVFQVVFTAISIIQIVHPFLTYYGVWLLFSFAIGGVVGGSVTNTNVKIADDFPREEHADDVRSFTLSYGPLGNFAGDALGGGLAIVAQKLALQNLRPRR